MPTTTADHKLIAPAANPFVRRIAVEVKSAMATGFDLEDIGIILGVEVGDACGVGRGSAWGEGMCDEAFARLRDEVEAALPHVRADPASIALHRRAARECAAEEWAEQRALLNGS